MNTSTVAVLPLLVLVAACEASFPSFPGEPLPDTAVTDLQLGTLAGDGPEAFGRISGLLGDPQGRIFVADFLANEIRVFDSGGTFQFSIGKEGSGPGELRGPCCLGFGPDGGLWVRDGGNHRYARFDLSEHAAVATPGLRMAHSDVNFMAALTFSRNGSLIDVGHRSSESDGLVLVRFGVSREGRVVDSTVFRNPDPSEIGEHRVVRETVRGQLQLYFYQPFAPQHMVAHGPDGKWATGVGSEYSLLFFNGYDTLRIQGHAEAPPLSRDELARAEARLAADAERTGQRPDQLPYGVPATKPPLRNAFFDQIGRLWVEKNTPDGLPRSADVWGENGVLQKRVVWPADVSLAPPGWVGKDLGLGIQRDSLGVEYVVRLRY